MEFSYEETPIADIHVRDFAETDRTEAKRRLDFIAAKLGSKALENISLSDELDVIK